MRLWHKDLIPVLPRKQLLAQWRECCLIAWNIEQKGSPNHLLVNPVMNYPEEDLDMYARAIGEEMTRRGYDWRYSRYAAHRKDLTDEAFYHLKPKLCMIFQGWHDEQYLRQCYYNLQEKHDRGGISEEEWAPIQAFMTARTENIAMNGR